MTETEPTPGLMRLGVVATSRKADEHRLPIHPAHFGRIDADLRAAMVVERGYGLRFGVPDEQIAPLVGAVADRAEVLAAADVVLLPKPQASDLADLRDGQVLWGWPHCVQDQEITQLAIDKQLTLIAWEAMNHWQPDGGFGLHVFHKNNELAGYCSVLHGMQLCGSTGDYGRRLTAVVIGFGATARGAVTALNAHGVHDVRVLTNRRPAAVGSPIPSVDVVHFEHDAAAPHASTVNTDQGPVRLAPYLAENDIVVNCTLQDPNAPLTYLRTEDLDAFRPGSLIVDVSVDEGMGFEWARATTFAEPMVTVGDSTNYYAVDHSPSLLWNSSTWEISEALMPFLRTVMTGPSAWTGSETIRRAIEIENGHVRNEAILTFQGRSRAYPYPIR
ncbi:alanine dehydrogenase [Curtobacterium sp. PhB130]|uniref:N(5)-(carboxyethyl)ornithine synthase n=1 Tax=unclassified Curtobacterium TaxID=257496 RepID=UPI000F4B1627|nr:MULTISPECIES: N(5)-(carboxyethyl)ornithine synthase [unclassified Curtobacterium]ROS73141.1 alanine dehydrogenase [Curtobacterium sp. PhB130]TCK61279.1 alanine dehydrogenase [Curtobacterium sp. PhB136]